MAQNKKYAATAVRFGPVVKVFGWGLLLSGAALGYLWQQGLIGELGSQIKQRELRLEELANQNEQLRRQLALRRSPLWLTQRARELHLSLAPPKPADVWVLPEPVGVRPRPRLAQGLPSPQPRRGASHLPPPVTPSDEEPIAAGGR